MNYLSYFDVYGDHLSLEGINLTELAQEYGTPIIVYSKRRLEANVKKLKKAFDINFLSIRFSVKSNNNPTILSLMKDLDIGIDASNLNETLLALRVGFPPEKIIVSPNNLTREELLKIGELGVILNFDDIQQMELLRNNLPQVVSFRINPGIGKGEFKQITTGGKGSKFGIPPSVAKEGYKLAKKYGCKRFGIHMMTGSNVLDASFFRESSKLFFSIAEEISKENNIDFEFLDLGGGFGVPYRENEVELDIDQVAKNILENFSDSNSRGYFKKSKIYVEPGRYLIANTAVLLATVTNVKKYDGIFVGLDVSMNSLLRAPLYGAIHPLLVVNKARKNNSIIANVVGQVCENTDILFKSVKLPEVEIGDIIAVLNAGAYITSMGSNYNMLTRPKELLLYDGKKIIIKREEGLDDMLATFKIPVL